LDSECSGRKLWYCAASNRVRLPLNASFMQNYSTANISNNRACTSHSVYLLLTDWLVIFSSDYLKTLFLVQRQHENVSVYNPNLGSAREEHKMRLFSVVTERK
jgi:hypothetical protein